MPEEAHIVVDLGPRVIMVGNEILGRLDNISVHVAQATADDIEKLKSADSIQLVKEPPKAAV